MSHDAQVPQGLGPGRFVIDLRCEPTGPLQVRNRRLVVPPNELVETADPKQRLGLAARVAQRLIQLKRALEQRQFSGIFRGQRSDQGSNPALPTTQRG